MIAINIDGSKPAGENWHQELLNWMAIEIKAVRPAVISESSHNRLGEYRGFRHVVRNVYTVNFDPAKICNLVDGAPELFSQVRADLLAFAAFLDQTG